MAIILGALDPIGTVKHSMLTESQFQSQAGTGWVLCDGRSVTGSIYAILTGSSSIPDATGRFLRGKGANNPDGSLALGTYSADKVTAHDHSGPTGTGNYGSSLNYVATGPTDRSSNLTPDGFSSRVYPYGGNETAPKSITVNIFIRIN